MVIINLSSHVSQSVDVAFDVYLLQVNYLHCHGIAHTELRLENVHISPVDRHIKVVTNFLYDH